MSAPEGPTGPITTVLFDFAGVLTSSPWGPMAAAGGGHLVAPGEAVFLDDAPGNVAGARRAGLHALHVERRPAGRRRPAPAPRSCSGVA